VLLCLVAAMVLTAGGGKKAKPFLAWVVQLAEPKKKGRRKRRKR
jgi:hypothetical protein